MTTNRLKLATKAVRPQLNARMMLSGPPGSGKTRTALIIASTLAPDERVLVIDTERESALTYADDFGFEHLPWAPPYDPRELADAINTAGDTYRVIVVDSLSHFWRKAGGTLDIAEGKFSGWKVARPAQEDMVDAILNARAHMIVTVRAKTEYVQQQDERTGKQTVTKLGLAPQQDDTLEYEVNVAAELDIEHRLTVSKSRSIAVPVGRVFQPGHAEEFAVQYRDWLANGEQPIDRAIVESFKTRLNNLPDGSRQEAKADWLASLGRPETLRTSQVAMAEILVARYEATVAEQPVIAPSKAVDGVPPQGKALLKAAQEIATEKGVQAPTKLADLSPELTLEASQRLNPTPEA